MKGNILKTIVIFAFAMTMQANAQTPIFTSAKPEKVQLYFNGAEIQESTTVNLPQGTSEVVVMNVANYLDVNSVQIKSIPSVTVMSVQFTNQPIEGVDDEYIPESVRPVYDEIKSVEKELEKTKILKTSVQKSIMLLDENQKLSGESMNVAELSKLVTYYQNKRYELEVEVNKLAEKEGELTKKMEMLRFQMGSASSQNSKNVGKLVLQVMNESAGKVPFQFNYVTYNARWAPFYEIRIDKINTPLQLKYNANVVQNSGVDWNQVKLGLTSGYVNQHTQVPTVSPWFVGYENRAVLLEEMAVVADYAYDNREGVHKKAAFSKDMETGELSPNPAPIQLDDKSLSNLTVVSETQLNVVFDIDIPYTVLSNGKNHSVALKTLSIPAKYTYYVAPKYDTNAYLIGSVEDYGKYNLLSGQANIIFEGMYVGKTTINPSNTDEKLLLSLGKDKKVNIERKLVAERSGNKVFSSKKTQSFTYEISVRNQKNEMIEVEVEDQYPISTDASIKVTLLSSEGATVDKEKGTLKWKLQLAPNATQKIRFGYQIESDRDKEVEL